MANTFNVKLPASYARMNAIKEANYPFNQLLNYFLTNLAELSTSLGINTLDVIGYVDSQLVHGHEHLYTDHYLEEQGKGLPDEGFAFRCSLVDEVSVLYDNSPLSIKHTNNRIVDLLMRLSEVYGLHIESMAYPLKGLVLGLDKPKQGRPPKKAVAVAEKATIRLKRESAPVKKNVSKPKVEASSPVSPQTVPKPDVATTVETVSDKPKERFVYEQDLDSRLAETQALLKQSRARLADEKEKNQAGAVVKTNSALGDFMDL